MVKFYEFPDGFHNVWLKNLLIATIDKRQDGWHIVSRTGIFELDGSDFGTLRFDVLSEAKAFFTEEET